MGKRIVCVLCILAAIILHIFVRSSGTFILVAISVLLPAADIALSAIAAKSLRIRLEMPGGIRKSENIKCIFEVENRSPVPLAAVMLTLEIENILTNEQDIFNVEVPVAPYGRRLVEMEFSSKYCGRLVFKCKKADVRNIFGILVAVKLPNIEEKRTITPDIFPVTAELIGSVNPSGHEESDEIILNRKGIDHSEVFQIRDYVQGDSLKQIHWKLSQKLERYIVADPAETIERALLVFWDRGVLSPDTGAEVVDAIAEGVSSFCLALAEQDIPYSVAWSTEKEGMVEIRDITCTDDLFDVFSGMLSHVSMWNGVSSIPGCISMLQGRHYPLIAYFCTKIPEELPLLSEIGMTTVFLCSGDGEPGQPGDMEYRLFTPENYKETLRYVVI